MNKPDVKSEYYLDPDTGQRYLITKLGGAEAVDGSSAGLIVSEIRYSVYGNYPQYTFVPFSCDAGAANNDVLYTNEEITSYNTCKIQNNSGVLIDVQASLNGVNYVPVSVENAADITAGGGVKYISIAATKIGILRGNYKGIKILQAGAGTINAGEVVGAFGVE